MTNSVLSATGSVSSTPPTRGDAAIESLARVLRQQRREGAALVRLVEQAQAAGDKGKHVNYYA